MNPNRGEQGTPLAQLSFAKLREYRCSLQEEEIRASYWRRVIQGRIDLLDADITADTVLNTRRIANALRDSGSGRVRRDIFLRITGDVALPDLPDLSDMWKWNVIPDTPEKANLAHSQLKDAEQRISAYREGIHRRLDQATAELVLRYKANPDLILGIIPKDPHYSSSVRAKTPDIRGEER